MTLEYQSIRALNWSSLKNMAKSPLEYQWRIDHPEPDKTCFIMGGAIHCLVLEPEKFNERFALCEVKRDKRHTAYQEWLDKNEGKRPLTVAEWDHAHQAADAVARHDVAKTILDGCRHEESLTWDDPDTGLQCKGRVDAICPDYVVELKTSRDPSPRAFTRDAASMLYHGQIAFYHYAATTLRLIDGKTTPYFVVVDKEPPFDVACYAVKPIDLDAGRNLCLTLMRKLEACIASDMWPGVAPDLLYLELPGYAAGREDYNMEVW